MEFQQHNKLQNLKKGFFCSFLILFLSSFDISSFCFIFIISFFISRIWLLILSLFFYFGFEINTRMSLPAEEWDILTAIWMLTSYLNDIVNFINLNGRDCKQSLNILSRSKATILMLYTELSIHSIHAAICSLTCAWLPRNTKNKIAVIKHLTLAIIIRSK